MIEEDMLHLLQRLHARTADGHVNWERARTKSTVTTAFGPYVLSLRVQDDPEWPDQPDFYLKIANSDLQDIEEFSNYTLAPLAEPSDESRNVYRLFSELYAMARRRAMGTDTAIKDILGYLK